METRKIRSLNVSPVGMGCMAFSHGYGQIPEREYSIQAIRDAYDFGCNFFDTAEGYGSDLYYPGHNEEIVGEALSGDRKDAIIATKFFIADEEVEGGKKLPDALRRHLEASLKRLQRDRADLYYLHRINENIRVEDVAEAMAYLIDEGLVLEWGLSQVDVDTLDRANRVMPVGAVQNLYNMMERSCEEDIFPYCIENGITVVPFSPVASGFLSGKVTAQTKFAERDDVRKFVPQLQPENIEANQPVVDMLSKFAESKGATNAQIALAWMLHKYENVVPIPGSKNKGRILENLGSWNVEFTDDEFTKLEAALDACEIHGHRGHVETQQNGFGNNWRKDR